MEDVRNDCVKVPKRNTYLMMNKQYHQKLSFQRHVYITPRNPKSIIFFALVLITLKLIMMICKSLLRYQQGYQKHIGHNLFFDNSFTTVELIHYLDKQGTLVVGVICSNCLLGCLLIANKDLQKQHRGSYVHKVDNNGGVAIGKKNDNSVVQLISNFVLIEPIQNIQCWNKHSKMG